MMFPFSIEILISGILFFLGVYAAISMQKAAQQFVAVSHTVDQSDATTSSQRAKSLFPSVIGLLVGLIVLPHIPTSYISVASVSFTAGMLCAASVFLFQKVRISFL